MYLLIAFLILQLKIREFYKTSQKFFGNFSCQVLRTVRQNFLRSFWQRMAEKFGSVGFQQCQSSVHPYLQYFFEFRPIGSKGPATGNTKRSCNIIYIRTYDLPYATDNKSLIFLWSDSLGISITYDGIIEI